MERRILLSFLMCAFVFCCTFAQTSFAMTKEQTELSGRIDLLQSLLSMKRTDMLKKMGKPESTDAADFICNYESGLTTVNLEAKKLGDNASGKDKVHYITAKMKSPYIFTAGMLNECLGNGIRFGTQLIIQKEKCQYLASFDDAGKCTKIDLMNI